MADCNTEKNFVLYSVYATVQTVPSNSLNINMVSLRGQGRNRILNIIWVTFYSFFAERLFHCKLFFCFERNFQNSLHKSHVFQWLYCLLLFKTWKIENLPARFFVYIKLCLHTRRVRCYFLHTKFVYTCACPQSVYVIVFFMNAHNLRFRLYFYLFLQNVTLFLGAICK